MIFKVSKELLFFLKEVEKLSVFLLRFKRFFFLLAVNVEVIERETRMFCIWPCQTHFMI